MEQKWNRIVEVRGKGGAAEGLEYFYPCNHSSFVSTAEVLAAMSTPEGWTPGGGDATRATCPEGCKVETEETVKEALNQ